jgi:formylglycine-generating enzyme required for sulfatase activity
MEVTASQFEQFVKATNYLTSAERSDKGGIVWGRVEPESSRDFDWRKPCRLARGPNHPVTQVSYADAREFCRWLSDREGVDYALPTEAQWEFACRAGTQTPWFCGQQTAELEKYAWGEFQIDASVKEFEFHAVGQKRSNAFGLFDMLGNAQEWCRDWYSPTAYSDRVQTDPTGPQTPDAERNRVVRGGAIFLPSDLRSAIRRRATEQYAENGLGFRVAVVGNLKRSPFPSAIGPLDADQAREKQTAYAKNLGVPEEIANSLGMKLRLIPPGEFAMGSSAGDIDRFTKVLAAENPYWASFVACEGPGQRVQIEKPFYLGACEVTVAQFRKFVEATHYKTEAESNGKGMSHWSTKENRELAKKEWIWSSPPFEQSDEYPVVGVSWNDAQAFCQWLSQQEGRPYVLPTEAQWEFACRAGNTGAWCFGDDASLLADYSWNTFDGTRPVGTKKPNAFGLFDMHGNAHEYCLDSWIPHRADPTRETAGIPKADPDRFVIRGGCFVTSPQMSRSAYRRPEGRKNPTSGHGFRVAIVGDLKDKAGN